MTTIDLINRATFVVMLLVLALTLCLNAAFRTDGNSVTITFGHPKLDEGALATAMAAMAEEPR